MSTVVLYGRPGCCLCDDAREVLERVRARHPFGLQERDIEGDEALLRAYLERNYGHDELRRVLEEGAAGRQERWQLMAGELALPAALVPAGVVTLVSAVATAEGSMPAPAATSAKTSWSESRPPSVK